MGSRTSRYISERVKRAVIERAVGCSYCGVPYGPFEFDHIVPVCLGGTNDEANVALSCLSCNRRKRGMNPSAFLRKSADRAEKKARELYAAADELLKGETQ